MRYDFTRLQEVSLTPGDKLVSDMGEVLEFIKYSVKQRGAIIVRPYEGYKARFGFRSKFLLAWGRWRRICKVK